MVARAYLTKTPAPRKDLTRTFDCELPSGRKRYRNDAAALVLYRAAVAAAVTGSFVPAESLTQLVLAAVVGVAVGLAIGALPGRR